jgi:hypothetical protein
VETSERELSLGSSGIYHDDAFTRTYEEHSKCALRKEKAYRKVNVDVMGWSDVVRFEC